METRHDVGAGRASRLAGSGRSQGVCGRARPIASAAVFTAMLAGALVACGTSGSATEDGQGAATTSRPNQATTTTEVATTSTTTTTAPPTTAPPTTAPPTTAPNAPAPPELRVDGLGPLQFGMSVSDAVATGFVTDPSTSIAETEAELGVSCGFGYAIGGDANGPWVALFADLGYGGGVELVRIDVMDASIRTTEGLGIGSKPGEIQAAVTNASAVQEGEYAGYTITAPFRGVGYQFTFDAPDGPAIGVAAGNDDGLSLAEGCA